MATGLLAFIILLFGVVALAQGNEAIASLDLSDSDDSGLGETSSAFFSNINYNGGDDDYEDDYDEYEDDEDDDSNDQIRINVSFDTRDSRSANSDYDTRKSYYEKYYRYLRCYQCYQYCLSYYAYYNCGDGNSCYCIPTQQTSSTTSATTSHGPQKLPGNSCQAYYVQIIGSGLGTTCDAFCKTIGLGKLIGVCIYNQCTCEAMQQYNYPYNGNSGYQTYNRQYRSIEVSNNTVNVM